MTNQDREHLRLLSIFHYVVGALAGLFACMPVIHLVLGAAMASGAFEGDDAPMRLFGVAFMVIAGLVILAGWIFAALVILAGRFLARHRHYTFCVVMAGVECIFMPFGTVLGALTLVVLMREGVKEGFGG